MTTISDCGVELVSILYKLNKLNGSMIIENNFKQGIKFIFTILEDNLYEQ